jgi:hypothetical protein
MFIKMINADVHCSILFILVLKFPDCMLNSPFTMTGFLYIVFGHYCLTIKVLNLCIHFFVFFLLLLVKFQRLYLHGNYSLDSVG